MVCLFDLPDDLITNFSSATLNTDIVIKDGKAVLIGGNPIKEIAPCKKCMRYQAPVNYCIRNCIHVGPDDFCSSPSPFKKED